MSDDNHSALIWILRQLLSSQKPKKRPLQRGLKLSWHPPAELGGECELWAGRLNNWPSEAEDLIILDSLQAAAKAEGMILAYIRRIPGQTVAGRRGQYGITIFKFKLMAQPPLLKL